MIDRNGIETICIYPNTNNINKKLNLKSYEEKAIIYSFFLLCFWAMLYMHNVNQEIQILCFLHLMLTMYSLYAIRVCPCMAMTSTLD